MTETYVLNRGKKSFTNFSSVQYNTSVNPTITNSDWDFGNWSITGYEIRTDATTTFSTGAAAGNRELPAGNSSLTFLTSPINSEGYRLKLPIGTSFTMNAAYDYFVVIYSTENTSTDSDYVTHRSKTHIGKITQQIRMDTVNDGIEFSPPLSTSILENQKFQIYKGPAKTDTNVVAVSYGLLGHINHGERYGRTVPMVRPLFYFYNERLEVDNQLDYTTKYTLLKQVLSNATPNAATNSSQSYFTTTQDNGGRIVDKSPFTYNAKLVDNLKTADTINSTPLSTLVDNTHGSNSTYTPSHDSGFNNITKNIYRSTTNNTINLLGPKRYIEFNLSPTKSNTMPYVMDLSIKKNISKTGSFGEVKLVDSSKILDEKIIINDDFVVKELMFEQEIQNNVRALMPGFATKLSGSTIKITQLERSNQLEFALSTGENSKLLTNANGEHGLIRINDYIYFIDSDPIDDGTRDTTNNWWTYTLSIAYYRHINDKFWTAVGTLPEDFTNANWFREEWSPTLQNLKVDFNLHKSLFPLLEYNLRGAEFSGLRLKMSAVESERKVATISNIPSFSYHGNNSINLLSYFSGTAFIDKEIFNGSVEVLNSKIDLGGQLLYEIKGRDDIKKLLGPLVNKSYKFAEDMIYSTSSPIQDIAVSNVKLVSNTSFSLSGIFAGDVGATTSIGSDHSSWVRGTKLYTSDGRFIASVKSVAGSAILFEEPARIYYPKTSFIYVSTTNNVVSSISIQTNYQAVTKPNTLNHAIDKGLYFNKGKTNILYGGLDTTLENLHSVQESKARGYSINSPSSFNNDEPFYFRLATEGASVEYYDIKTVSSLTNFDLVTNPLIEPSGNQKITIAPVSPFVLGRIDKNSLDTRYTNSQGLYFLNSQSLTTGGFVNLIDSKTNTSENSKKTIAINRNENNIYGSPMYKYTDLTVDGNINYEKIILDGNNSFMQFNNRMVNEQYSEIKGVGLNYATAYKFKEGIISNSKVTYVPFSEYSNILSNTLKSSLSDGTQTMLLQPPETRGYLPILGSNFADFTYYDSTKPTTWPFKIGLEYTQVDNPGFYEGLNLGFAYGLNSRDDSGVRTTNTQIGRNSADTISVGFGMVFSDAKNYTYKYSSIAGAKSVYEVFDPKCLSYHIFGPCDIFNDSFNNVNNLAYSLNSYSFEDFGIMGINKPIKTNNVQAHDTYKGSALSEERDVNAFSTSPIISSSITPSQMKRFSLGRLIELTFDMHFNMIDVENITDKKNRIGLDSEEKTYFKSRMCEKTPIKYIGAVAVGDQKIFVSNAEWFKPHVAFLSTASARTGQLDILFNDDGIQVGFVKSTHQHSLKTGTVLTITSNTSDAAGVGGLTLATTTNGDGEGLKVVVTENSGAITSVTVDSGFLGNNYAVGDTVTLTTGVIGGSDDVVCTIPANSIDEPYILLLNSNDTALISSGYSSAVNSKYLHLLNSSDYGLGANIACNNQSYIWGMRLESDATINANKDTQLYQPILSFEIGHFEKSWLPQTGALIGDDRERYMDNRFMQLDFSTLYKRFTPGNVQEENHTASYIKQLFNESGRYFGIANDPKWNATDLDTYGPAYIDYSQGASIGDGSNSELSFPENSRGYNYPKLYLGFAFASHPMFNVTTGVQQAMDLENGRLLTPFHSTFYYKKGDPSTTDFLSEMSGQFVDLDNENSGSNVAKGVSTITVQDASIYDVGNKLYYYEGNNVTKPVFIGIVQSVNTSTEVVTLTSATTHSIPSGSAIKTFRCHVLNYWHPSRLFQYIQGNPTDKVKYGLGNKSYSEFINEGGIYSTGNFVLLQKQQIGRWHGNPANSGTSFSMRYNLEANDQSNVAFNGTGANILDYSKAQNKSTEGAYWQSDVFTTSMKNSSGTETDNGFAFGMPIFSTTDAFTPFLYNTETNKSNGYNGPDDMNVSGLWTFKPQMVLMTSTNTAVSAAGSDFSADDRHKRIDNSDIRKITIDFSTLGLMNAWLNFSPNLTGYYLVSNSSLGSNAPSVNNMLHSVANDELTQNSFLGDDYYNPQYIHQIIKHEVRYAAGVGINGQMIHDIWIDNAVNIDATLVGYRVMRWAENCTYDFSPEEIPLYSLSNKTTKHPTKKEMYQKINRIQLGNAVQVEQYNGMFTRKTNEMNGDTSEGSSKGTTGTNEGVFSMYVVLDAESENSNYTLLRSVDKLVGSKLTLNQGGPFYINDGKNKKLVTVTPIISKQTGITSLLCSEMIATKGIVSFGEPFEITVPKHFKTGNLDNIKIGSTFTVGNTVENIINDLMESNNIVYNKPNVDVPYYISPDITGLDLYNALTFIGNYQNIEPIVINKDISMKSKNNIDTETNITVTEGESNVSLSDKQETMFDIFNKIIVYGDTVKSIRKNSQSIAELGLRELEEVDKNLRTQGEVDDRASQLLNLHSTSNIQIEMQIDKLGLEYIEVGDLITVDYPTEIPVGKYMILQIHHEIGRLATYTLGKYTAGLDFKLAEIINANRKVSAEIRGADFEEIIEINAIIKELSIKELEIEINESIIGGAQTLGFNTLIGFSSPIGFIGLSTSGKRLYKEDLT